MPKFNRRQLLQGLTLTSLTSLATTAGAMEKLPPWWPLPRPKKDPSFPESVEPWPSNGSAPEFPREGIQPPEEFDFPIRTTLPFAHGVASGDPLSDRVMIWTRITLSEYPSDELQGEWRIASDPAMKHIINQGRFTTNETIDWTVKIDADGLLPYTTYYYQFFYNGAESCVGRTRTAPASWDTNSNIRFAVCACSSYFSGHMNGYGRIADKKDLDFVIHCGDYIYDFPDEDEQIRVPNNNPDGETNPDFRSPRSLYELRRRYALYRSDPNLFRAHQQHPWLIIWDNHDIGGRDQLTDEESFRAFWEWTPSRQPDPNDLYRRHDRLSYGQLADIFFTDRHYKNWYPEEAQPNRDYLGVSQNQILRDELAASKDRGAYWRILINQTVIGQFYLLNPPASADWVIECLFPDYKDGIILNPKQWDGYPQERTDLINFLADNNINNNLFVTGDMHMNYDSDVAADPGSPANYNPHTGAGSMGIEFAPSSISRGGADETIRGILGDNPLAGVLGYVGSTIGSNALFNSNPNCHFMEWTSHGYGIVDMHPDKVILEHWWTSIMNVTKSERLGAQLMSWKDSNHLERISLPIATQRISQDDGELAYEVSKELLQPGLA